MGVPIANDGESSRRQSGLWNHWALAPLRWVVRAWRARTPRTVELEQAKTQMDELIDDAEHGKPFAISVEGKPILKVTHMDQDAVDKLPKAED